MNSVPSNANKNADSEELPTKRQSSTIRSLFKITRKKAFATLLALTASPFVAEAGCEVLEHATVPSNVSMQKIERSRDNGALKTGNWFESANITSDNDVRMFIHAGGNATNNMPLAVAVLEELDEHSIPVQIELRIDEGYIATACKQLQIPVVSTVEFNEKQPSYIIQHILRSRYPTLADVATNANFLLQIVAEGPDITDPEKPRSSYTEAHDYALKLPDAPGQVVLIPMYSEDTLRRSYTAMTSAMAGRVHLPRILGMDFDEYPEMSTKEVFLDHLSWRARQFGQEFPQWMKKVKYREVEQK